MSAVLHEQITAVPKRFRQIKAGNAPARPTPMLAIPSDNNGRTIKLLEHPCSDDADHTDMPRRLAFNNDEVCLRFEFRLYGSDYLFGDRALELLTLAILRIELLCQVHRRRQVRRQQQPQ